MIRLPDELMFIKNGKEVQKKSNESMNGKVCVISGATSGVGLETVKALAAGGANIVIVARNINKAQAIQKEIEKEYSIKIDYFIADFADLHQVRTVAKSILDKNAKIDVLINSVGIHSTKRVLNKDGLEMAFCVNHLAPFLFTTLLIDRMIESAPARIVQVNSEGHRFNGLKLDDLNWERRIYTGLRGYGASKTAQLFTVWELAEKLKGTKVTINAVHPGGVKTNIGNNNGKLYKWFLHHITWHFLKDPKIAGDAIYYLASAKELAEVSGKFFNLTIEEKPAKHALNAETQKKMWDLSNEIVNLLEKEVSSNAV